MRLPRILLLLAALGLLVVFTSPAGAKLQRSGQGARVEYVIDGDTVVLTNGRHVRLVQIDTPEVYNAPECYGKQASRIAKRLLRPGTAVRLYREPETDAVDAYGRLLRYVVRVGDELNVNVDLVRVGAAAPYFYSIAGAAVTPDFSFGSGSARGAATSDCGAAVPARPGHRTMASRPARHRSAAS